MIGNVNFKISAVHNTDLAHLAGNHCVISGEKVSTFTGLNFPTLNSPTLL
jgi:hypothetical protein